MTELTEKIRPYYGELIGYMAQAPSNGGYLRDKGLWEQFHSVIDQLSKITQEDYERFKLSVRTDSNNDLYISSNEYRSRINGLIMNLHAKYFREETSPFSGVPHTIVTQNQHQSQNMSIVMIMEVQSLIDKQLYSNHELSEKQKGFLEKVKANLPNVKTSVDLISTVLNIAKTLNLDLNEIVKTFGL